MEGLNLQLLLKDNNKIILDFLRNEFVYIIKDNIINDIKKEIYNMLFNNNIKKSKSKTCDFARSRKRGTCKRLTNSLLCPYHLKKVRKEYENTLLPDKNSSGNLSGSENIAINKSEDEKNEKNNININNSYYITYIEYLNDIYYNYDEIIYKNAILDNEIKIFENIDPDIFYYDIINKKDNFDKKKKKKNKFKKVIKIYDNININDIKKNIEITLNTFNEKVPKDEMAATLHILYKENKKLFKKYVNIILSNINMFFQDVNIDILNQIWKNVIEYIPYKKVLIYDSNNDNIIEKVFGYIRNNSELIPEHVNILWIDYNNNNIIQYDKKYKIETYKSGISIYGNNDIKKLNPLPLDKLTLLYY